MKLVAFETNTPEWLAWRLKLLGASDAAATIGWCKFKTPYQLWLEKTGRIQGFAGNVYTEAGLLMEPKARACYEVEHGFVDMPPICVEHPEYSIIGSSLDGYGEVADLNTILEIKYPSEESHNLAKSGEVPKHYIPQVQHQMMCVPEADISHYWSFRDDKGVKVVVLPDRAFQETLLQAELAFWELVKTDTPPPLQEKDAKHIDDPSIKSICKKLIELKSIETKLAKQESDSLKAQIIKFANHPKARCGNVLISSSTTKAGKASFRMTVSGGEA